MNRSALIIGLITAVCLFIGCTNKLSTAFVVDHSSPVSIMQTIFDAAKTGKVEQLPKLLPPKGKGTYDGDCKALCYPRNEQRRKELGHNYISLEDFQNMFSNSQIIETPIINEHAARINFLFDGNREETMNLQKIEGKWYLQAF